MEKVDSKDIELEEELDFLYRKVSNCDQSEDVFHPPQQMKTEAMVHDEPRLHIGVEKWPSQKIEGHRIRFSRIIFALLPALIVVLITIFFWPVIYHYDALNFKGKAYPLRINRLTGEAAYFDGAEWLRPPIPAEAKDAAPEKLIAQSAAVLPPEINQTKTPAEDSQTASAKSKNESELKYAIQIKAFPKNKKEAATGFVDDMKKKLPDVRMETVNIRGRGIWHRILLGHFSSMEKASSYMKETKISHTFTGSFVQRKSAGQS